MMIAENTPPDPDHEYLTLTAEQRGHVDSVVAFVRQHGRAESRMVNGAEYYSYPRAGGRVAWGINSPQNTHRGVKGPVRHD